MIKVSWHVAAGFLSRRVGRTTSEEGVLDGQQVRNLNDNGASGVLAAVPFQDGDDDGIGWDGLFPR